MRLHRRTLDLTARLGVTLSAVLGVASGVVSGFVLIGVIAATSSVAGQARPAGAVTPPTLYEGARLIFGDARPSIERGAVYVENGRIRAVGAVGQVTVPANVVRVDVSGKTIMPALVNAHVHIGYEGYGAWGADLYTPQNILDHLQRQALYGVGVTQTVGSSPTASALAFERDQQAGKFPPASRFRFVPGMAPPRGGPDAILMKGTQITKAVYEVTTPDEARAAVRSMAAEKLTHVKIWVDDRRGTYPKMPPEVYNAIIAEAHARGMKVHAHAIQMADQKAVVRAGADVLVHTVGNAMVDDELLGLIREHKPYWTTVLGLGDRSEVCNRDPFIDQSYPDAVLEHIREESCGTPSPTAAARDEFMANTLKTFVAAGARLVLGTDAGIDARHGFGWADHHEIARWVDLGVPVTEAIIAATSRPAELMGLNDEGVLKAGARADFLVLDANPLENIRNTRRISTVYLNGVALDRAALSARFKQSRTAAPSR